MAARQLLELALVGIWTAALGAQDLNEDLLEAVRKGDATRAEALIGKGANVNAVWRYGITPLFFACDRGYTQVVKLLLDHGAEVNVKDTFYGMTPLSRAAVKDHVDIAKILLAKGASSADSVLIMGAQTGKLGLVKVALDTGNIKKESLSAALSAATRAKQPEIANLLKNAGAVPPPPANYPIDAEALASYAGSYQGGRGGTEMEIRLEAKDGKLATEERPPAAVNFGRPLTFNAVNKIRFRGVEFDSIEIEFKLEGAKVTGFTLLQAGNETEFKRIAPK